MKPHMNNFSIVLIVSLFFFSFSSFSQEISTIENPEQVYNANEITKKRSDFSNKTAIPKKEATYSKNEQTIVLIKAMQELNNKLDSVISKNQMLRTQNSTPISSIGSE